MLIFLFLKNFARSALPSLSTTQYQHQCDSAMLLLVYHAESLRSAITLVLQGIQPREKKKKSNMVLPSGKNTILGVIIWVANCYCCTKWQSAFVTLPSDRTWNAHYTRQGAESMLDLCTVQGQCPNKKFEVAARTAETDDMFHHGAARGQEDCNMHALHTLRRHPFHLRL